MYFPNYYLPTTNYFGMVKYTMVKDDELQRCISILQKGGLIVAPSDTVYGLVCDATNEEAVKKLIAIKNRPFGKPISVFVDGFAMLEQIVEVGNKLSTLTSLLPGPFTVVLPSKHVTSYLLESERKTLGVRYTQSAWIQELVQRYGKPLTATSANISGRPPHYDSQAFIDELSVEKRAIIDHVVSFGKLPHNKPSTLIDLSGDGMKLLRKGEILPHSDSTFTSFSARETQKTAYFILDKYLHLGSKKPIVFILEGEMGAGKTVFAQGMGARLGVHAVISPTYVIYYEYKVATDDIALFLHADLYNIEESAEFDNLGIEQYLIPHTVVCVEWGNRMGKLFEVLKKKAQVISVEISYVSETERRISITKL